MQADREKILEIKKRKIESLNGLPIAEKYKHELLNKKVSFWLKTSYQLQLDI